MEYEIHINDQRHTVDISNDSFKVNGNEIQAEISQDGDTYFIHTEENISIVNVLGKSGNSIKLQINGKTVETTVNDQISMLLEKLGMNQQSAEKADKIKAPMPGSILDIMIKEGDQVASGQPLLILEAMKMENLIKSSSDGVIKKVSVSKGDSVEKNATLIEFE